MNSTTGRASSDPIPAQAAPAMSEVKAGTVWGLTPRRWREILAPYAKSDTRTGLAQLLETALPFVALLAAIMVGLAHHVWAVMALSLPAAVFLVRLFMIQHDCGHGSFFRARWANDLLGHVLGVVTLTPYLDWRRSHAAHHATTGNLDKRGMGDIDTLTVREYQALTPGKRLWYRIYRHPLVMFGIGPTYQFLLRHRVPAPRQTDDPESWASAIGTNLALVAVCVVMGMTVGLGVFLAAYLPVMMMAASIGVFLFYIQHQYEDAYWQKEPAWNVHEAALQGSSYYDLPRPLHWLTAYIGFHHIHHLSTKVPNYRLYRCYHENPELQKATRLTIRSSLDCWRLALWDEDRRKLVPFAAVAA